MPLSKKRVHNLELRLLTAERAKRRREAIRDDKQQEMPSVPQAQVGARVDSESESETETDSEYDEEDDTGVGENGNMIGSEGYMEECNVLEEENLQEKEIQTLQWRERELVRTCHE